MFLKIDENSSKPKYKQIVDTIVDKVSSGVLKVGEKIPSINELSEDSYLSRDTVEKAYRQLKELKVIISVKGKGYYTAKTELISKVNIFFLINKLSTYKMEIYNSFVDSMGVNAHVNLFIYHYDESLFLNHIEKNIGGYDYYVIMPHFKDEKLKYGDLTANALAALNKIPKSKLVLLDRQIPEIKGEYINIYQNFKLDIYNALSDGIKKLVAYKKMILVYPRVSTYPYPKDIIIGFKKFCTEYNFNFEVIDQIYEDMNLQKRDCYVTIAERDLVNLVKQVREKELKLGKEIGVVSYNDTPLKELLGITVISANFKVVGEKAAQMILENKKGAVRCSFKLIDRNSI